jgi:hypothetical protein
VTLTRFNPASPREADLLQCAKPSCRCGMPCPLWSFLRMWLHGVPLPLCPQISHHSRIVRGVVACFQVSSLENPEDAGQILTIKVTSLNQPPFTIRLSAIDYQDIDERVLRPIRNLRGVVIARSLEDEFLEVLERHVHAAVRYTLPKGEELDRCVGCMSSAADIKITVCRCRPMWCLGCLAKWFANNQPQDRPEIWLEGQGDCPTCRSKFNVNDIAEATVHPRFDDPLPLP